MNYILVSYYLLFNYYNPSNSTIRVKYNIFHLVFLKGSRHHFGYSRTVDIKRPLQNDDNINNGPKMAFIIDVNKV